MRLKFLVIEIDDFINPGYGWMCKHCFAEDEARSTAGASAGNDRARFLVEGEAESKEPRLSTPALARWRDATHTTLYCPRCGIEERVSKA